MIPGVNKAAEMMNNNIISAKQPLILESRTQRAIDTESLAKHLSKQCSINECTFCVVRTRNFEREGRRMT